MHEKILFRKDLNFYFLILSFQEKYDIESFNKTKKNIESKIDFYKFITFLKNKKLITNTLCKKITEKGFLKNYKEFELFIKNCDENLASFYIKFFYANALTSIENTKDYIENLDDNYAKDIIITYKDYFEKHTDFHLGDIFFVLDSVFKEFENINMFFSYISYPENKSKNFLNKEEIEELLDTLDAMTLDEISKNLLTTLRKEILK